MAAKPPVSISLFLSLNLLCFALVTSKFLPNCIPDPPRGGGCGHPRPPKPPRSGPTSGHKPGKCPRDALKLGVCANLLNDLVHLVIGAPPSKTPCCALIQGLADLEAAVCLCTAIRLNLLGINLNVPLSLSLLLNYCGSKVPRGFRCP